MPKIPLSVSFQKGGAPTSKDFLVHGQGVFVFSVAGSDQSCTLQYTTPDQKDGLLIQFTLKGVLVERISNRFQYVDPKNTKGIVKKKGAYYWFSLDSQNQTLMAGIGEPRVETACYRVALPHNSEQERKDNKAFLEEIASFSYGVGVTPMRLLRDPVTHAVPLLIKDIHHLTMNHIATSGYMPKCNLSLVAQKLHDCIGGKRFRLNDSDFPEFSKAIDHSIATPGLWCYEKLRAKSREFNPDVPNLMETYLRITLSQNNGESPGIPYVMEIWPIGHYSPVHNHSDANAIIRVLHGSIHVDLFPFLCEDTKGVAAFTSADFKQGDCTWISSTLNQTHQLMNLTTNKDTCITIQCYMYDNEDKGHYDYFDYIDSNGAKQQYEPDSDMDFVEFKALMKQEWAEQLAARSWWKKLFCRW